MEKEMQGLMLLKDKLSNSDNSQKLITTPTLPTNFLTRKERLHIIEKKIVARLIADTKVPMTTEMITFNTRSMEQHLTTANCPPDRYEDAYNLSFKIYMENGYGKGPWNIFYMLEAWNEIRNAESSIVKSPRMTLEAFQEQQDKARAAKSSCATCRGMCLTIENGKVAYFLNSSTGKQEPIPCRDCAEEVIIDG